MLILYMSIYMYMYVIIHTVMHALSDICMRGMIKWMDR